MATTRDQVAAYDYESRRRVTSLVLGADEAGRDPRRRLNRTLFGSAIIGVLVMAAFGIVGLLGGGRGPDLPQSGAVLVKGTGDRYVMVKGVLHPALNLASAMLVGGGHVTEVRASALNDVPRGLPVGIQGAPDGLPDNNRLARGPWTVCAQQANTSTKPPVAVLVGLPAPADGALGNSGAVLVQAVGQQGQWLVTGGRRYKLIGDAGRALGLDRATAITVPEQVLDTVPGGHDLAIPTVPTGGPPTYPISVPNVQVGSIVQSDVAGQQQYWLVKQDGVTQISQLEFTLMAARQTPITVTSSLATVQASPTPAPGVQGDWPEQTPTDPTTPQLDEPLCVSTVPGAPGGDAPWHVTVSVPGAMPQPAGAIPVITATRDLNSVASSVTIAPGTEGALARATTSSGQDGAYTLVTESGQRYPITSADAVGRLGLDPNGASQLPLPFVALLPAGPTLDPNAAAQEFAGSQTTN